MILDFLNDSFIILLLFYRKLLRSFETWQNVDDVNGVSKYFRERLIYNFGFLKAFIIL